jgi:putative ABC transport system permease protein
LAAAASGVGLALMLILLLDGLWAGINSKATLYADNVGADLFVAQPGTKNFLGAMSVIPMSTLDEVEALPDVRWATPVRGLFSIMDLHGTKVPAYLIGYRPGGRGGPWRMLDGRAPSADDEVAIGDLLRERHGIEVGDQVDILGRSLTVVGIADADTFMSSFVFMTHAVTDDLLRLPSTTSWILVGTDRPAAVRRELETSDVAVLDRATLRTNDLAVLSKPFATPLRVMLAVAFVVGSLIIALTAYSAIIEHQREYGIVKALGATNRRLHRLALVQSMVIASAGLATGAAFFIAGRWAIVSIRPQFTVMVTAASVGRAVGLAVAMGAVAAIVPARRLSKLDPSRAFGVG